MRYWLDTEFLDPGEGPVYLLSLGLVAADGRELYAVNQECPLELAEPWVLEHVVPQLYHPLDVPVLRGSRVELREAVRQFVAAGRGEPEFWAYFSAYDWVVLCQLMGGFRALPADWPQYCNDLRQWADQLGRPPLPEQPVGLHHALWDARWNRQVWQYLAAFEPAGPAQRR